MKPISPPIERVIRLVIASLFGLSLGAIAWMLTLPPGFISKRWLAVSVILAFLLAFLFYKALLPHFIQHNRQFKLRWGLIGIVLAMLTGIVYQLVVPHQALFFPFVPKQTLAITLLSDSVSFHPVECELTTLYSSQFTSTGTLIRVDAGLMTLSGKGATITWTGWPGENCIFTLVSPNRNTVLEVNWNGNSTVLSNFSDGLEEFSTSHHFETPPLARWIIGGIIGFAVGSGLLAILDLFMVLATNPGAQKKERVLRTSQKSFNRILNVSLFLLIVILGLRFLYGINPITSYPSRDSGVFLDIGQRLLAGDTPYLDYWDHKGPLIYFINALGKLLDPAGEWGIFFLQVGFITTTLYLIRRFLVNQVNRLSFGIGLAVFLYFVNNLGQGGNLVEVYALLFIAAGLAAGIKAIESGRNWPMIILGGTGALAFALRPNLIAVFIVTFVVWLAVQIKQKHKVFKGISYTLLGMVLILLPLGLFFISRHALPDLVEQVFRYNYLYSESNNLSLLDKITRYFPATLPVVLLSLFGMLFLVGIHANKRESTAPRKFETILTFSVLLEIIFSQISGFDFPHYSLPLMLIGTLILVLIVDKFYSAIDTGRVITWVNLVLILAFVGISVNLIVEISKYSFSPRKMLFDSEIMERYIEPQPTIFVWGAESTFHYLTGIPSPTRYVYQYPLVNDAYCTDAKGEEFLQDIRAAMPMIIDASIANTWMPSLPPDTNLDGPPKTVTFGSLKCLQGFFEFFETQYHRVIEIPGVRWIIYMPNGTNKPQ